MKDLYTLFEESIEHMVLFGVEDTSTTDMPFDAALAIAEEKCKRPLSDIDDETHGF